MAERPIFVPSKDGPGFVKEVVLRLKWHPGFAVSQKQNNVRALHEAAATAGFVPALEISSKSEEKLGQHLSAFHLKVQGRQGPISLECAFQGSKVFSEGGPYTDLYQVDARTAKRDPRLKTSGSLIGFNFEGALFPLEPKTAFYDWLYVTAIFPHREWLSRLLRYAAFSDIEFNPQTSVNCQARSCALFVELMKEGLLSPVVCSPEGFMDLLRAHAPLERLSTNRTLF